MKKLTLLTHLSYDSEGKPFISSPIPVSETKMPSGRLSGVFGRQAGLMATTYWWKKVAAVFNKDLSKVEVYVADTSPKSTNQGLDDLSSVNILNIPLAQAPLTDQLDVWSNDYSAVETKHLGDRDFFRRIVNNPEIINTLFDRTELAHINAIVWPAIDPNNKNAYIKIITIRSTDDVMGVRVYNFDGDPKEIPFKL